MTKPYSQNSSLQGTGRLADRTMKGSNWVSHRCSKCGAMFGPAVAKEIMEETKK